MSFPAQITRIGNVGTHKMCRLWLEIPQEHALAFINEFGWATEERPIPVQILAQPTQEKTADNCTKVLDKPLEKVAGSEHNAYSRRAGILSADRMFWRFIEAPRDDPATFAASYIRNQCGVTSRRDILPGTDAATTFDSLELAFKLWANQPRYVETP